MSAVMMLVRCFASGEAWLAEGAASRVGRRIAMTNTHTEMAREAYCTIDFFIVKTPPVDHGVTCWSCIQLLVEAFYELVF